ncbi:hypothetical protein QUW13_09610 [Enterococcus hirae]|nr:hypothetical protein [Enterococcaceae bacterium]MCI1918768.1 hypothetical protein [Enterococcaceae bacterium]MDM8214139.1 hypothetical protein [Enterococcus hirae]
MNQVMIAIILEAIHEQYQQEVEFVVQQLKIPLEEWEAFKTGDRSLSGENMQKIYNLFTDYEWMLVQKVLRQTLLFPEKRPTAVSEYHRLKTVIAKAWLEMGGQAEMITQSEDQRTQNQIDLRISLSYGEWGYDDLLVFRLPAVIRKQIKGSKVGLLEWVSENLEETYMQGFKGSE